MCFLLVILVTFARPSWGRCVSMSLKWVFVWEVEVLLPCEGCQRLVFDVSGLV